MSAAAKALGIHHITAMAGDAQANLDFYTRVLGLRLIKRTVNFDDPGTYHLYFGDYDGTPGSLITFFPWGAKSLRGRIGTGQVSATAYAIPAGSVAYWTERLKRLDIATRSSQRFDEAVIELRDRDGLAVELVADSGAEARRPGWSNGDVPAEHAIRGFHSASLSLAGYERTARLLVDTLGFQLAGEASNRFRFAAGGGNATSIDLVCEPGRMRGSLGVGVVHHIAFRAGDDGAQLALRERLVDAGYDVTPVLDRQYFHSIYFREPGGVLFEIATDPPGFAIDESPAEFGTHLKLPPWLERQRVEIEKHVPPLTVAPSNNP